MNFGVEGIHPSQWLTLTGHRKAAILKRDFTFRERGTIMVWGILGALEEEVALIKEKMTIERQTPMYGTVFYEGTIGEHNIVLVCCGIGKVNAAVCASTAIHQFGAGRIINVGIAGAMKLGLSVMDVVISSEVAFHDQDPVMLRYYPNRQFFEADPYLISLCEEACASLPEINGHFGRGRIVSGDVFVNDSAVKADINKRLAPSCVEMEGAAIGQVSYMNGKPFLVIRTMSDSADEGADTSYDNFIEVAAEHSAKIILKMLELAR